MFDNTTKIYENKQVKIEPIVTDQIDFNKYFPKLNDTMNNFPAIMGHQEFGDLEPREFYMKEFKVIMPTVDEELN